MDAPLAVDDFKEHLVEMTSNRCTREEMLTWLSQKGIEISLRTLNRRLAVWQANRRTWTYCTSKDQLAEIIDHLFHHHHTFSDHQIAKRIKDDYQMDTTARQVKEIRLECGWFRRNNDLESAEAQEASTFNLIEDLFPDGHIRQYGRRQLIAHLSHKHGHRPRSDDVRKALQMLDNYGATSRIPGMKKKRRENYIVPGPDWLWCLDEHDKLARYGIEIYGCAESYSRKIVWFFVDCSNRTQVSVLRQYFHTSYSQEA
jgi:arsenate reductase-like glutaredoxin family protein